MHFKTIRDMGFTSMLWVYRNVLLYSGTWELGTPKGLPKIVLNSEVVLFLRYISMYWTDLGAEVAVLNSQGAPISQVVLMIGFTVFVL